MKMIEQFNEIIKRNKIKQNIIKVKFLILHILLICKIIEKVI